MPKNKVSDPITDQEMAFAKYWPASGKSPTSAPK
jgi:hypothetical protein